MNEDETVEFVNFLWSQWPNFHVSVQLVASYHAWAKQHGVTLNEAFRIGQKALEAPNRVGPPTTGELEAIRSQNVRREAMLAGPSRLEFDSSNRIANEVLATCESEKYKKLMRV